MKINKDLIRITVLIPVLIVSVLQIVVDFKTR